MKALTSKVEPPPATSYKDSWVYGWTHYGITGQTKVRMNKRTRRVEIKEHDKWIKCRPGSDEFFTLLRISKKIDSFYISHAKSNF